MAIKITKISDNTYMDDEKKPFHLIAEVKSGSAKGLYIVNIIHPNIDAEGKREVLLAEEVQAKDFNEAMDIANEKKNLLALSVITRYEEIKYIRNGKKGFVKLKTKESEAEAEIVEEDIHVEIPEADFDDDEPKVKGEKKKKEKKVKKESKIKKKVVKKEVKKGKKK